MEIKDSALAVQKSIKVKKSTDGLWKVRYKKFKRIKSVKKWSFSISFQLIFPVHLT